MRSASSSPCWSSPRSPDPGIVGATLVAPGEAVEYGQELIVIELAARSADAARTAERTEA